MDSSPPSVASPPCGCTALSFLPAALNGVQRSRRPNIRSRPRQILIVQVPVIVGTRTKGTSHRKQASVWWGVPPRPGPLTSLRLALPACPYSSPSTHTQNPDLAAILLSAFPPRLNRVSHLFAPRGKRGTNTSTTPTYIQTCLTSNPTLPPTLSARQRVDYPSRNSTLTLLAE